MTENTGDSECPGDDVRVTFSLPPACCRDVLLEIGARSDNWPCQDAGLKLYAAGVMGDGSAFLLTRGWCGMFCCLRSGHAPGGQDRQRRPRSWSFFLFSHLLLVMTKPPSSLDQAAVEDEQDHTRLHSAT